MMMIRSARLFNYLRSEHQKVSRKLSAQAALSFKPSSEDEYAKAKPFNDIPGLSKFELIRRFIPGGKYHNKSILDIQRSLRREFGDFYRLPGLFGQTTSITTYDADDVQFVHRNEGTYPYRRGLETMKHFRENIRSDVYAVGGLIIE